MPRPSSCETRNVLVGRTSLTDTCPLSASALRWKPCCGWSQHTREHTGRWQTRARHATGHDSQDKASNPRSAKLIKGLHFPFTAPTLIRKEMSTLLVSPRLSSSRESLACWLFPYSGHSEVAKLFAAERQVLGRETPSTGRSVVTRPWRVSILQAVWGP